MNQLHDSPSPSSLLKAGRSIDAVSNASIARMIKLAGLLIVVTLFRAVRRKSELPDDALNIVGIYDWPFRRNYRYGTVGYNLKMRRIIRILPDWEIATVSKFIDGPKVLLNHIVRVLADCDELPPLVGWVLQPGNQASTFHFCKTPGRGRDRSTGGIIE